MNTKTKNEKIAFFTIDVERFSDTECIYKSKQPVEQTMLDGLDRYIEILDKHNIKVTMFVLADFADTIVPQLKKYISNGHKVALHGERHVPPTLLTNDEFREQIVRAKNKLEKCLDTTIAGYRAPCFGIDNEKLKILQDIGLKYDSSIMGFSAARHRKSINMTDFEKTGSGFFKKKGFFEFAISLKKIFGKNYPVSGGGYLRVSNWLFARFMLNSYFRKNDRYIFYSHPFEFSAQKPPKIKQLKLYDKFYINYGLSSYQKKLEYIIKKLKKHNFKFSTFEDYILQK